MRKALLSYRGSFLQRIALPALLGLLPCAICMIAYAGGAQADKSIASASVVIDAEKVEGKLDRLDDFVVSLTTADGTHRSFRTPISGGDAPKVEVHDPLQPHKDLLRVYTDADIHNVTAFLVTLK